MPRPTVEASGAPPEAAKPACAKAEARYRPAAMFEPAFVTLLKIVGTLVIPMSVIPLLFLTAKGVDTSEPTDIFDTD